MDVTLSPRARAIVIWIAVALGALILVRAAGALTPFAWAIITAYILHPFVARIHRRTRLPRQLIAAWVYAIIALVLAIFLINVSPLLLRQLDSLQQRTIPNVVGEIDRWLDERRHADARFAGLDTGLVRGRLDEVGQELADLVGAEAVPLLLETFSFAIETFVYLVASFYLIVYGDRFVQAIRDILNRRYHREFDRLLVDINSTLGAYLRGQVLLVIIMSSASYVALRVLDVDYALSLAIATGFLELIPLIGPWTAGTIAVTIAFFQEAAPFGWSNVTLAIVVGLVYFTLRQLEDAFVIPLVIGRIVHLHPLLVIFVLVIGTSLGGPLGLILAVPAAAVIKIVVSFFYAKLTARQVRHVETVAGRGDLERVAARFPDLLNGTVVLLIEHGALDWSDLPLVQRVADAALDYSIDLSVVTPDGVAGALATAAGIATTTVPLSLPVLLEPSLVSAK